MYLSKLVSALAFCGGAAFGQWATPSVDGAIGPGEYGSANQVGTSTAQTWYMRDSANLYVGITNANLSEGAVIYVGTGVAYSSEPYDSFQIIPATVDLTPSTGSITLQPAVNGQGWNNVAQVSVKITAADSGGSGLEQIRYWVDNGPTSSAAASTASEMVSGQGKHVAGARTRQSRQRQRAYHSIGRYRPDCAGGLGDRRRRRREIRQVRFR